jgi:ABC-2 type transport system permease protein
MRAPFAIAIRIFQQLANDHRTIGMIVVVPLIMTLIFGYAFTGETYNNPIVIVNLDEGATIDIGVANITVNLGESIVEKLREDDRVEIVYELDDIDSAREFVTNRSVDGLIFLPADLSNATTLGANITLTVLYDEAEPAIGGSIFSALFDSLQEVLDESGNTNPFNFKRTFAFGEEEISGLDIALPGIIGYISLFLIILLTVILIVREDLEGTKSRFLSSPINRWQVMLGYMLGMMVFAILISTVVLFVSIVVFSAEIRGDLVLTFAFTLYFALGSVMLALFLARIARNEFQAVQLAVVVAIPSMALSGFMVPINTLPDWLGIFSNIIPLTYAIEGLKSIMLRGLGFEGILFEVGALTIYSTVAFLGAVFASKETIA